MVKTGSLIVTVLSVLATLAPLLPVIVLFVWHVDHSPVLLRLRILCAFTFLHHLYDISGLSAGHAQFVQTLFGLTAFAILYNLFMQAHLPQRVYQLLMHVLVSYLSVIITIYAILGTAAYPRTIPALHAGVLLVFAVIILVTLIRNGNIVLVREPLFWIAGGVLCFYGMQLLLELVTQLTGTASPGTEAEKWIVYRLADTGQFVLYTIGMMAVERQRPS